MDCNGNVTHRHHYTTEKEIMPDIQGALERHKANAYSCTPFGSLQRSIDLNELADAYGDLSSRHAGVNEYNNRLTKCNRELKAEVRKLESDLADMVNLNATQVELIKAARSQRDSASENLSQASDNNFRLDRENDELSRRVRELSEEVARIANVSRARGDEVLKQCDTIRNLTRELEAEKVKTAGRQSYEISRVDVDCGYGENVKVRLNANGATLELSSFDGVIPRPGDTIAVIPAKPKPTTDWSDVSLTTAYDPNWSPVAINPASFVFSLPAGAVVDSISCAMRYAMPKADWEQARDEVLAKYPGAKVESRNAGCVNGTHRVVQREYRGYPKSSIEQAWIAARHELRAQAC